jgi:hypothetical protein
MAKSIDIKTEYFSTDGKRYATIENGDKGVYITTLYELDDPVKLIGDKKHSRQYWEDCCENWVMYWGDFSK